MLAESPQASWPRIGARAPAKSLVETPLEVQDGDQGLDARALAHVAREDAAGEGLALAFVVDPRLAHGDVSDAGLDVSVGLVAVPDDQPVPALRVPQAVVFLDVGGHFGLDGSLEHPAGSFPEDLLESPFRFLRYSLLRRGQVMLVHERILCPPARALSRGATSRRIRSPFLIHNIRQYLAPLGAFDYAHTGGKRGCGSC